MKFDKYLTLFDEILTPGYNTPPYDNPDFIQYTKLNSSRMNRWLKKGDLLPELVEKLELLGPQRWILITEPWCGDASHIVPFMKMMASVNDKINLEIQLRDSEPFLIDQYLTNGGKSIPILVVRDENDQDLFVWGPRPKACQGLLVAKKEEGMLMENIKKELQQWYNKDKGASIQQEFLALL